MIIPILGTIIPNMGTKINLSDALFSKTQQRVLTVLYGQPDRHFYTNEIIRLTDSGRGAIQRELEKLVVAGLLTVERVGNQKQYQANLTASIFTELRGIVLKTFGLVDVLKQALAPVASQIHSAFIYGSIAKQEDTANSDIDLMLLSDTLAYPDLFLLLEKIEPQVARPINPSIYSVEEWQQKLREGNNFLIQVVKQPKIFLIGTDDELSQLR